MKRLLALLLALLMLCSAAAACAEPVLPAAEIEEIKEIEIVPVEEAVEEEEIELEPAEPELPSGEEMSLEEALPGELPEEELIILEEDEEIPEEGNEAAEIITSHPRSTVVSNGAKATFTVVSSYSNPSYQWQWRASSGDEWGNTQLNGWNTATLSFTATLGMNGRQYRCVVTEGSTPRASAPATLTVTDKATIASHPSDTYAPVGGKAKFTVTAAGKGLKYQWQWRPDASGAWADTKLNGWNTATLNFTVASGMGGRQYRCHVTDSAGGTADSNPATLTIGGAQISTHPADASVPEGGTASFTVKVIGTGLSYQWQWRANSSGSWADTQLSGCRTATLKVTGQAGFNGRQYRCKVVDRTAAPAAFSNAATLTVKPEAAKIVSHPSDARVDEDGEASFTVSATGSSLKYQWQWRANSKDSWKDTKLNGWDTAKLEFTATAAMNRRQYRCGATASVGTTAWSNPATLLLGQPPVIYQQPESWTTCAGGTASFYVGADGDNIRYQWKWRASASEQWKNTTLNGYDTDTLEFDASESMDGRQYCCCLTDRFGNETWSKAVTLTVRDVMYIDQEPSDARVQTGKTASFILRVVGEGVKYQWKWRANSSDGWKDTHLTGYNTNTLSFTSTQEMNGRQYYCEAVDKYGDKVESIPATLTVTAQAVVPTDLSYLLDLSESARITKLKSMGFTVTIQSYETGEPYYEAERVDSYGYISAFWDNLDGAAYVSVELKRYTSALYSLAGLDMSMNVSVARSALASAGWSFEEREEDDYYGYISYNYSKKVGGKEYGFSISTYDETHIDSLYENVWYK